MSSPSPSPSPSPVLLIDNYDSFTNNLCQAIYHATHIHPIKIYNNTFTDYAEFLTYLSSIRPSCIFISPGPGHPAHAADFGICRPLLKDDNMSIPLFGVCLGLQGMVVYNEGSVVPAAQPRHGRLSAIYHTSHWLFERLQQGFKVVRYNSLVGDLSSLPSNLKLICWSHVNEEGEGGVKEMMGVEQIHCLSNPELRPLRVSVQFHPESICSTGGGVLMDNWFKRVEQYYSERQESRMVRDAQPIPASIPNGHVETCAPTDLPYTTHIHKIDGWLDPEVVFSHLIYPHHTNHLSHTADRAGTNHVFWLDSAKTDSDRSKYSYMGNSCGPHSFLIQYHLDSEEVHLSGHHASVEDAQVTVEKVGKNDIWQYIQSLINQRQSSMYYSSSSLASANSTDPSPISPSSLPIQFLCGLVGYVGYEMKAACQPQQLPPFIINHITSSSSPSRQPSLSLLFADRMVTFDHVNQHIYLLALGASSHSSMQWIHRTTQQLAALHHSSTTMPPLDLSLAATSPPVHVSWRDGDEEYLSKIKQCLHFIQQGESYELCLTNRMTVEVEADIDDFLFYRVLRRINPAPYAAFFHFHIPSITPSHSPHQHSRPPSSSSSFSICCSSPELFQHLDSRTRMVESKPIKGTCPRGTDAESDERLKAELSGNEKDFSENLMIVDLLRHDLSNLCHLHTVSVPKLMQVESYSTLHQLVSTVSGYLPANQSAPAFLRSVFPPGSMTGAPKLRSCQILDGLEGQSARGIYSGCIGYFGLEGGMDMNVVIRTALLTHSHGSNSSGSSNGGHGLEGSQPVPPGGGRVTHLSIGAGGAIVHLSDPQCELDEVALKTKALMNAIRIAASRTAEQSPAHSTLL